MPAAALGRSALWIGFFAVILASWWVMYTMATGMGMDLFGRMAMPMGEMGAVTGGMSDGMAGGMGGMSGSQMDMGMTSLSVLIPMWMIMMAAMMGPTFVFATATYGDLITTGAGSRAGQLGLVLGFLMVWFGFGAVLGVVHTQFFKLGWLNTMGSSTSALFSAALLIIAGLYQFTPLKDRCAAHCRSPMVHFLAHWRPGFVGGVRMGARDGAFCIGCCWAIMALGFVGGAMNLAWMGAATLIMTLEKLPDLGRWMTRPLGAAFCVAGLGLALTAF
ncbi:MAG: DUF2182 domain-containing protein [Pseudomonadota bacterium]